MTDALAQFASAISPHYALGPELGQGGMAMVFRARDLRHDREVALKLLRPELAAILGRERFLSEVRLTARLDHPHILTLIDSGEADGYLWYTLPLVRGESLRHKLDRERQLPLAEAVGIARQVAGALEHAHRQGIIHRDVKPENILLHEGEAMLTDFGIALAVREAAGSRLTETGMSIGSPQYMSPEQATAERILDARTDIYSLGAVLYEMLAGEAPFTGVTAQAIIAKLITERPTSLRTVRQTVPEPVDAAVARALAKVPADRFASAVEFADALSATGVPAPALPRSPRRRRLAFAAGIAALGVTAVAWAVRTRTPEAPAAGPLTVALLPFVNQTGDRSLDDVGARATAAIGGALLRDARDWVEPVRGTARATGFDVAGTYTARGDSLEFRIEIRDGPTGRALTQLAPVVVSKTDALDGGPLTARVAAAVGWLGLARMYGQHAEFGSFPRSVEAVRAMQAAAAAQLRGDWRTTIAAAERAASLEPDWIAPVMTLVSANSNLGQVGAMDSLSRTWFARRFELLPIERASLELLVGWATDQELAFQAGQRLLTYDSVGNAYNAALVALMTNRPRTALGLLPLRLRDSTELGRLWVPWAGVESWAYHALGDHRAELAAMLPWRAALPQDPTVRMLEAQALIALGQLAAVPLMADSLMLGPPVPNLGPDAGMIPAYLALEARAHGHPGLADSLLTKATAWYEARATDTAATMGFRFEYAQVLTWAGHNRESRGLLEALIAAAPDSARFLGQLGVVAVRLGDHALAARMDQRLGALDGPRLFNLHTLWRGNIAAALGNCARAVDLLRRALLHGQAYSPDIHVLPLYDPIRECQAFQALLRPRD